ncbi:MAG: type IV toxin-antitoxin system AbiEi family antitoxin domain-containing protein [Acidimicrobiales bacterium]
MDARRWTQVAAYAARHHGLLPHTEAARLGYGEDALTRMVANGLLVPVGRGLSRLAAAPITWEQRVHAACLLAGDPAVASHGSAGVLWGMAGLRPGRPEVTAPAGRSARSPAVILARVHRSRQLPPGDRTVVGNIPVTTPERTLIDLSGRLSPPRLADALDGALLEGSVDLRRLRHRLDAVGRGRAGARRLRTLLALWKPGPASESLAEMQVLRSLVDHGIPAPARQYEVREGDRLVARVDAAWPWAGVACEIDSWRWHGSPGRFHQGHRRTLALRALGWDVVTATNQCLDDGGEALAAAVRAALDRGAPPPCDAPRGLATPAR